MEGPARVADFTGRGALILELAESGEHLLTGLWQPDDPESAYDELHRLYMSRERLSYTGPVESEQASAQLESRVEPAEAVSRGREVVQERTLEVIILEWTNEEHPAALKLQEAVDSG